MSELRRLIVDTDTGSDDCWAIIEALRATDVVRVEAVTVVCGNFPLDLCVKNAMLDWVCFRHKYHLYYLVVLLAVYALLPVLRV